MTHRNRTNYLLGRCVEAMGGRITITDGFDPGVVRVEDTSGQGLRRGEGPTLFDALTALLADLGVVVEWPSEAEIDEAWQHISNGVDEQTLDQIFGYLSVCAHEAPALLAALLDGEEAPDAR